MTNDASRDFVIIDKFVKIFRYSLRALPRRNPFFLALSLSLSFSFSLSLSLGTLERHGRSCRCSFEGGRCALPTDAEFFSIPEATKEFQRQKWHSLRGTSALAARATPNSRLQAIMKGVSRVATALPSHGTIFIFCRISDKWIFPLFLCYTVAENPETKIIRSYPSFVLSLLPLLLLTPPRCQSGVPSLIFTRISLREIVSSSFRYHWRLSVSFTAFSVVSHKPRLHFSPLTKSCGTWFPLPGQKMAGILGVSTYACAYICVVAYTIAVGVINRCALAHFVFRIFPHFLTKKHLEIPLTDFDGLSECVVDQLRIGKSVLLCMLSCMFRSWGNSWKKIR